MQKKPFWHYFRLMFSLHYSYGTFLQEELFGSRSEEMKSLNDCYLSLSSLVLKTKCPTQRKLSSARVSGIMGINILSAFKLLISPIHKASPARVWMTIALSLNRKRGTRRDHLKNSRCTVPLHPKRRLLLRTAMI